ncbi:diguanylate cyclase [Pseudoduganella eburnea]|uniref:diguanylate cyclase n=1 Tax=Massilia eburnea TaxID=1776165 RepID=A0A6L6QIL5_9BURK|nr:ligand-binding sensor domain-containing diguanylate cyclase [Massilia eburnea]MTW12035.1 diguanylate cyclase [Massilia eburnea]
MFRLAAACLTFWALACRAAAPEPVQDLGAYQYRSWALEQGLPHMAVHGIRRDASGALWVGTEQGLVRSYGSEFEIFGSKDTPALGANWIRALEPAGSRLYIATQKNLAWWDGQRFSAIPGSETLGTLRGMAVDPAGKLWILADRLSCWDGTQLHSYADLPGVFTALGLAGGTPTLADNDGRLWTLRDGKLLALPLRMPAADMQVKQLLWRKGQWWLGTTRGLWRWTPESGEQATQVGAGGEPVDQLSVDNAGRVWVLAGSGLKVFDGAREVAALAPGALSAQGTARALLAESLDDFWVGSMSVGLRHYWNAPTRALQQEAGGKPLQTWSYVPTSQGLLVGTDQGIWRTDGERMAPFYQGKELQNELAYSMLEDRQQRLWIGTRHGLMSRQDGRIRSVPQLDGIQVNTMLQRADGRLFAGTTQGLYVVDPDRREAVRLFREQLPGTVSSFMEAGDGSLWIGGANGLWRMQGSRLQPKDEAELGQALVMALAPLGKDGVLVGTYQHGIHAIDSTGHRRWMQKDGLPSDGVGSINLHEGWYWVTYFDGIYRFRVPQGSAAPEVQLLHVDPGNAPGRNRIRCCNGMGRDKGYLAVPYLWAASLAGAVRTRLDVPPPSQPQVVLRKLLQDDAARELEVGFEGVEFREPELLQYRYRLSPFQKDWKLTGRRRTAYFTNLPSGEMQFEAQASWDGQHWGEAAATTVRFAPAWHERWPVRIAILLLAGLAVYGAMHWRLRRIRNNSARLQREVDRHTAALRKANAELESLNRSLEEASLTDPLTGLHNRRFVQQELPGLLARLRRRRAVEGATDMLAVLLVDFDHFKQINDSFGHAAGDAVLRGAANALRREVRGEEHAARWGGEEFLLLVNAASKGELWTLAHRVHAALALHAGSTVAGPVTASVGIATLPIGDEALDERAFDKALKLADYALYVVKSDGRNGSALAEPEAGLIWPEGAGAGLLKEWHAQGRLRIERG